DDFDVGGGCGVEGVGCDEEMVTGRWYKWWLPWGVMSGVVMMMAVAAAAVVGTEVVGSA
nr:hypothetical protein [Tanacetum cinerariifolium]